MDRTKFEQLYTAYSADVYRLALSYLHSVHDAQDVCHEVFMKLLTRGIRLSPEKEKAFLLTCTANACKDLLRSFWRTHTQPLDDVILHVTESDKSLWEAIGKLPPKYRVVIHLYYYEGYSQKQIAEILKISRAAVQARMDRARTQLEKELRIDA